MSLQLSKSMKAAILAVTLLMLWLFYFKQEYPQHLKEKFPSIPFNLQQSGNTEQPNYNGYETVEDWTLYVDETMSISELLNNPTPTKSPPSSSNPVSTSSPEQPQTTPLILYAYAPSDWALSNLEFFLIHGLHASASFIFIFNGALSLDFSPAEPLDESLAAALALLEPFTEKFNNIRIIKRPNTCYDLGAYGEVLLANEGALYDAYERFILINVSLRGPFIPFWSRECWSDAYLRQLDETDHQGRLVKLVGMTYNCWSMFEPGHRHVQSMLLATDKVGMGILLGKIRLQEDGSSSVQIMAALPDATVSPLQGGLQICASNYGDAVDVEISLTPLIMAQNYTVRTMMALSHSYPEYHEVCMNQDVNDAAGAYEGGNLAVWETMFLKTNRQSVDQDALQRITNWMNMAVQTEVGSERRGSWDVC